MVRRQRRQHHEDQLLTSVWRQARCVSAQRACCPILHHSHRSAVRHTSTPAKCPTSRGFETWDRFPRPSGTRIGKRAGGPRRREPSCSPLQSFRIHSRGLTYLQQSNTNVHSWGTWRSSMATASFMDSKHLQEYELALDRLEASQCSKKQRPIVERGKPTFSQQEAVSAAAKALGALWNNRPATWSGSQRKKNSVTL
jgi:hypothetical protein